jgi:hypothetical protein
MNDPGQMQGIHLFNMKGFASYHQRDEQDFGHRYSAVYGSNAMPDSDPGTKRKGQTI